MDFAHASLQIDTCNIKQTSECSTPQDAQVRREGVKTGRVDGEEDDVSGTEEHLSEYFLAIQKVLHDIATKLTNTHRRTCHNIAAARGKKLPTTTNGSLIADDNEFLELSTNSVLDLELDVFMAKMEGEAGYEAGGESTSTCEKK